MNKLCCQFHLLVHSPMSVRWGEGPPVPHAPTKNLHSPMLSPICCDVSCTMLPNRGRERDLSHPPRTYLDVRLVSPVYFASCLCHVLMFCLLVCTLWINLPSWSCKSKVSTNSTCVHYNRLPSTAPRYEQRRLQVTRRQRCTS